MQMFLIDALCRYNWMYRFHNDNCSTYYNSMRRWQTIWQRRCRRCLAIVITQIQMCNEYQLKLENFKSSHSVQCPHTYTCALSINCLSLTLIKTATHCFQINDVIFFVNFNPRVWRNRFVTVPNHHFKSDKSLNS